MHIDGQGNVKKAHVTPMKAVKAFCLECQGGMSYDCVDIRDIPIKKYSPHKEVRECTNDECWLYEYRTGKRDK
jgi:hypothetical protein